MSTGLRLDSRPGKTSRKGNPEAVCGISRGGVEAWMVMPKEQNCKKAEHCGAMRGEGVFEHGKHGGAKRL